MNEVEDDFALMVMFEDSKRQWSTRLESLDDACIALKEIRIPTYSESEAGLRKRQIVDYDLWERNEEGNFYPWIGEHEETFKEYCETRDLDNKVIQIEHICEFDDHDHDFMEDY